MPPSTRRPQGTQDARTRPSDETRQAREPTPTTSDAEDELPESHIHDEDTAESRADQDADDDDDDDDDGELPEHDDLEEEDEEQEEEEEEEEAFPPPGLKEISSLASWTVSTAKPGNGVAALRSADVKQFWQSDGPQPHTLSIHFFKLVPIVRMRIYLDFVSDESYTPTKIQFLAGMGVHDLLEFAEMSFEQPTGWIDVDFRNVGNTASGDGDDDDDAWDNAADTDWSKKPVLRAFLVQVRILENHQNGKDTHLRAVQLFARDEAHPARSTADHQRPKVQHTKQKYSHETNNIKLADWMMDPDIR